MKLELKGVFVPITTPFEKNELAFHHLTTNLQFWKKFELAGYVLLGSTGEAVLLNEKERLEFVETALKYIHPQQKKVVGVMDESLLAAQRFIKTCAGLEVDAALVLPPRYYRSQMTPERLEQYFLKLADASPIPLIIYHFPAVSGITFSAELTLKLATHTNIVGMKDSSANIIFQQQVISAAPPHFQMLTGSASTLASSLAIGATGGIVALANVAPALCLEIYQSMQQGNYEKAMQLQRNIAPLNTLLTSRYGVGGMKFAMDKIGLFGGLPREPLQPPDKDGQSLILKELKRLELL